MTTHDCYKQRSSSSSSSSSTQHIQMPQGLRPTHTTDCRPSIPLTPSAPHTPTRPHPPARPPARTHTGHPLYQAQNVHTLPCPHQPDHSL
jgi:hypothetical protein